MIVHLSATDVGSGVAGIWHSVNGGPWEEGENVTVGTDALERSVVRVAAVDHYGNWEQDNSFTIGYDFEGPTPWFEPQTSDGLDVWVNHDSWVRVGVTDDLKGAGVKDFEVSLDGGGWKRYVTGYHMVVTRAEKDHGNDGAHRIACRGTDRLDNLGPVVERSLAIDTRRPRAAAGYVAHARSRGTGTLRLKISDASPCSRACRVVVTITTTSGKKLGVLRPDGWLKTGSYVTLKFSCPLAGRYKFVVRATDSPGNLTVRPAWNYLVVSAARGVTGKASPGVLDLEPLGASPPVTLRHASVGL